MDLISKKELLETTGISYGQLYRWKREKLIPEDWFIKQSSFTGQETFFPKEQVLNRVDSIMKLKDDYSLEEIAKMLSPEDTTTIFNNQLDSIFDTDYLKIINLVGKKEAYTFYEVAFLSLLDELFKDNKLSNDELKELVKNSLPVIIEEKYQDLFCTIFKTLVDCHVVFHKENTMMFDKEINIIKAVSLSEIVNKLKIKYMEILSEEI